MLFDEGLADRARVARQADGVEWLRQLAAPFSPEATRPHTGIDPRRSAALARDLAPTPRAAVYGRMGTCTGRNGTLTTYLIDAVNLVAGNLDQAGRHRCSAAWACRASAGDQGVGALLRRRTGAGGPASAASAG